MEYYPTIDELLNSISDVLLRVLLIVQQLLQENRHGSKRDIYYMHPSVFSGKSELSFSPNFKWYFFLYSSFPIIVIGIWKMHVQWNKFEYLPLIYTLCNHLSKKKNTLCNPFMLKKVTSIILGRTLWEIIWYLWLCSGLHLSTLSVILKGISQHLDISEKSELKIR